MKISYKVRKRLMKPNTHSDLDKIVTNNKNIERKCAKQTTNIIEPFPLQETACWRMFAFVQVSAALDKRAVFFIWPT